MFQDPVRYCMVSCMILYSISSYKPCLANITASYPVIVLAHRPCMEATRSHIPSLLLVGVHVEHSLPEKITGKRKFVARTKEVH